MILGDHDVSLVPALLDYGTRYPHEAKDDVLFGMSVLRPCQIEVSCVLHADRRSLNNGSVRVSWSVQDVCEFQKFIHQLELVLHLRRTHVQTGSLSRSSFDQARTQWRQWICKTACQVGESVAHVLSDKRV